ncbi:uncharacterized protein FRV6_00312 [Fusarium oxysporum]|uniref:2EXR domain-containing protein n=1 Tax=Fusarium oxysporum TaxID=5507 RepID=A0A2H3SZQ4_FUSOX|nr:uncharacterized protein FRV6_00312 [Fusarium oxysporum]
MAVSSFHPFPRLPLELRLLIWSAACNSYVSYQPNDHALHYVDLEPSSDGTTLLAYHKSTADVVQGDNNSACLSNALWGACKESRDVVARHSRVDGQDQPHSPAMLSIRDNEGHWNAPVCPTKDIFCVKSSSWETPDGNDKPWQVALPNLSLTAPSNIPIQNIAFEFDLTWDTDLPGTYYDLMSENSARGFLSRFCYNAFLNNSEEHKIWLFEKTGQWSWSRWGSKDYMGTSFHDCDTEYVEIHPPFNCDQCHHWHKFDGIFDNLFKFIHNVGFLSEVLNRDHPDWKPEHDDWRTDCFSTVEFYIDDNIQYLARRDKQVKQCPGREDNAHQPPTGGREDEDLAIGSEQL